MKKGVRGATAELQSYSLPCLRNQFLRSILLSESCQQSTSAQAPPLQLNLGPLSGLKHQGGLLWVDIFCQGHPLGEKSHT